MKKRAQCILVCPACPYRAINAHTAGANTLLTRGVGRAVRKLFEGGDGGGRGRGRAARAWLASHQLVDQPRNVPQAVVPKPAPPAPATCHRPEAHLSLGFPFAAAFVTDRAAHAFQQPKRHMQNQRVGSKLYCGTGLGRQSYINLLTASIKGLRDSSRWRRLLLQLQHCHHPKPKEKEKVLR
jgi:hypothetical protein